MKTLIIKLFLAYLTMAISLCFVNSCYAKEVRFQIKKVGIIIPIEHEALREIAQTFQENLSRLSPQPIKFNLGNAQGDNNLQRAIISQMINAKYDLIVPISTVVTQMASALITTQPIVGLAADISNKQKNLCVVNDEINKANSLAFIHKVYPQLKKIAVVHSTSNKIFNEVEQVETGCRSHNIIVQRLMIQNLSELYSVSQAIQADTQAIFILKDNLIASGIKTLVQIANQRKIPLITSDEGTVKNGAGFSLGIHEKDIGIEGAKLAARILQGTAPSSLSTIKLTKTTVFINSKALKEEGQNKENIKLVANQLGYPVEEVK